MSNTLLFLLFWALFSTAVTRVVNNLIRDENTLPRLRVLWEIGPLTMLILSVYVIAYFLIK